MMLYIAGAGHSGSSLLDVILNNHPQIVGTGELHRLSLNPDTRLCSCGEVINDCPVWRRRIEQICKDRNLKFEEWEDNFPTTHLRDGSVSNKMNDLVYWSGVDGLIRLISNFNPFSIGLKNSIQNTGALHDTITSRENVKVVVDNTKNAIRMKAMSVFLDAKIILLVRDGRAVTASAIRRGEGDMPKVAKTWVKNMRNISRLLKSIPGDQIHHVQYEELCNDTESTITKICEFLGLEYDPKMLKIYPGTYHTIPGNPWLIKNDSLEIIIRKDERWKEELSNLQLDEFEKIGGTMNRKIGYKPA